MRRTNDGRPQPVGRRYRDSYMGKPANVQIYTMQSVQEAMAVAASGVDHVGVTASSFGLPGEVSLELAGEICRSLSGVATSVALSVDEDMDQIELMVRSVQPDILHLCGPPGAVGPGDVLKLRERLEGVAIMQAIAVTGPEAVDIARSYEPIADFFLLDSVDPTIPGVGAAGVTHDWAISAAIVKAVDAPVILAGGLSPDNVGEAIDAVQPWGVDSLTHTNAQDGVGGFRKDITLVSAFVASAKGVVAP
jgi:phosphoribosylanthranilate isomerase